MNQSGGLISTIRLATVYAVHGMQPEMEERGFMKQRATVVCQQGTRVLLVGRERGRWSLPGGKPEHDETLEEAAVRELFEETLLRTAAIKYMFEFAGMRTRHYVFVGQLEHGQSPVPSNEIARCCWAKVSAIPSLATSVSTKAIVQLLATSPRFSVSSLSRRQLARSFAHNMTTMFQDPRESGRAAQIANRL
jgi:8-oxo-dGTP diphosphatase